MKEKINSYRNAYYILNTSSSKWSCLTFAPAGTWPAQAVVSSFHKSCVTALAYINFLRKALIPIWKDSPMKSSNIRSTEAP